MSLGVHEQVFVCQIYQSVEWLSHRAYEHSPFIDNVKLISKTSAYLNSSCKAYKVNINVTTGYRPIQNNSGEKKMNKTKTE